MTTPPALVHFADLLVEVGAPLDIGETGIGVRRIVPIIGGRVAGRLNGAVLAGGADWQLLRADGMTEVEARYTLALADGALVYIENAGIRHGPPEAMERLRRGEPVDPALIYFRTVARFETAAPHYAWLTRMLVIGVGARRPTRVEIALFAVE